MNPLKDSLLEAIVRFEDIGAMDGPWSRSDNLRNDGRLLRAAIPDENAPGFQRVSTTRLTQHAGNRCPLQPDNRLQSAWAGHRG